MSRVLVFGSGMSAIANSIVAHSHGLEVDIYDSNGTFAAGWGSDNVSLGENLYKLDKGIRLPVSVSKNYDNYLFNDDIYKTINWYKADSFMSEAILHKNFFNISSSCLDLRKLGLDLEDLNKKLNTADKLINNEEERLIWTYGKEITEKVFKKICVKRFGIPLNQIPPYGIEGLVPKRLLLGDKKFIEKNFGLDSKINQISAHLDLSQIPNSKKIIYPHNTSVDDWIHLLKNNLVSKGINIDENFSDIESIQKSKDIYSVLFTNGTKKSYNKILWSKPFFFLPKKLGYKEIFNPKDLDFRVFKTVHLLLDHNVNHEKQYVLNFERPWNLHRAIFWQNLPFKSFEENIITLELQYLKDQNDNEIDIEQIKINLENYGLLNKNAKVLDHKFIDTKTMIPIITTDKYLKIAKYEKNIKENFKNLHFSSTGGIKFLDGLFEDAKKYFKS